LGLLAIAIPAASFPAAPSIVPYVKRHRAVIKSLRARLRGAYFVGEEGVVLQAHHNDCGAATLAMVLAAHGIHRDLTDLYHDLRTTEKGTSLLDLRLVSTRAGLPARSWSLSAEDLGQAPLPAIAFVSGNHFVVIRRFLDSDVMEVDDPGLGRLRWPLESFCRVWSGEVLVFDSNWTP
jgi:ABC-type bacteriocin/lantibiotic exporter with double-glycine peptidase domain